MQIQKNKWRRVKLRDVCEFKYGKSLPQRKRIAGEFPVYGSGGIVDTHNEYFIEAPGIIVGRKGSIGTIYFSSKDFCPIDTVFYIEKDETIYDVRFLYYFLKNLKLDSLNSDAAVPGLNRNVAYDQDVLFPRDIVAQKKIASVLSAYDDLIENNTKRIKILEETAQAIYKEWFVNFRFPGYEKVKMINSESEFGKVPEGWEVKKVGDIIDLQSGFAFKSKNFIEGGRYKIITIKNVHDGQFKSDIANTTDAIPEKMPKHCNLSNRDILLSLTGNVGRTAIVFGENQLLNQRVAKLHPKKEFYKEFIYALFRNLDFKKGLKNLANGSAQQNLSPVKTGELEIVFLSDDILKMYSKSTKKVLYEIVNLNNQNQNLRQTRDLLLPKLVSGEININ
ncbi:restriction endonuclease subunit S [Candidatus Parcubacteria bacterium]|nr:restriction endonuclease subunit S [Candidatus Parcubacteria bacterium]